MNFWTVAQISLDFLLTGAVFFLLFRFGKGARLNREDKKCVAELTEVRDSLNQLLRDAVEVSSGISKEIERKRSVAEEIFSALDKEKSALAQLSREIKSETQLLRKEAEKRQSPVLKDKYAEAIKLAETGLSAEEIAKRTQIPLGEVELALSLRK